VKSVHRSIAESTRSQISGQRHSIAVIIVDAFDSKISYFYALSVSLIVIYSGDHYVVDIIAGVIYSTFAILTTYSNWLEKLKNGKTAANI